MKSELCSSLEFKKQDKTKKELSRDESLSLGSSVSSNSCHSQRQINHSQQDRNHNVHNSNVDPTYSDNENDYGTKRFLEKLDDERSYGSSSEDSKESQRFHKDKNEDAESGDEEDEVVDFLPEVDDNNDKDEVEDKGLLDEKALANLKAQEEGILNAGLAIFEEIDFHPDEAKPPNMYMYSAYFEHLRHTLNTYLRRPIKKQFISNTKKCVLTVHRNQNRTIEAGYNIKNEQTFFEQSETLLDDAKNRWFN